jgi:glucans biosynthesis protein C
MAITAASLPPPRVAREPFLDWLRILAFALLVPYHVGMYYVSWDFHIKSAQTVTALEPWMKLFNPWRMDLIFLVSGAATACMLRGRAADGTWLRERARRLLWPLLFGVLVIVPPQSYIEVVQRFGYADGWWRFWGLYLSHDKGFTQANGARLILPTWNHLWYLPYLFSYTLLLWAGLRWRPAALDAWAARCAPIGRGALLLALPIAWLWLTRLALRQRFPETHALVDDWLMHAQYLPMFLAGAVLARSPGAWAALSRWRRLALALGLLAWVGLLSPLNSMWPAGAVVRPLVYSAQQWSCIVAAVGFAHAHLSRDHPWRARLTEAVFPVYILHQTLILVLAHAMRPLAWPPAVEAPLLVALTFALAWLGFEAVSRVAWLRPAFGLKRLN